MSDITFYSLCLISLGLSSLVAYFSYTMGDPGSTVVMAIVGVLFLCLGVFRFLNEN